MACEVLPVAIFVFIEGIQQNTYSDWPPAQSTVRICGFFLHKYLREWRVFSHQYDYLIIVKLWKSVCWIWMLWSPYWESPEKQCMGLHFVRLNFVPFQIWQNDILHIQDWKTHRSIIASEHNENGLFEEYRVVRSNHTLWRKTESFLFMFLPEILNPPMISVPILVQSTT